MSDLTGAELGIDMLGDMILGTVDEEGTVMPHGFTISASLSAATISGVLSIASVSAAMSIATISASITVNEEG